MIEFAKETDKDSVVHLWNLSFGDEPDWIRSYYVNRTAGRTLLYRTDDRIVAAMLEMLPVSICDGEKLYSGFYIYAACTLPECRGQGLMHDLIESSCAIAQKEGLDFASLIPQTDALISFYEQQGFNLPVKNSVWTYYASKPSSVVPSSMSEDEFIFLKERYERQHSCVMLHDRDFLRLLYRQTLISGGSILKLSRCGDTTYAVCLYENNRLKISELSANLQRVREDVDAICQYFQSKEAVLLRAGEMNSYARIRPLHERFALCGNLYMNTMLEFE